MRLEVAPLVVKTLPPLVVDAGTDGGVMTPESDVKMEVEVPEIKVTTLPLMILVTPPCGTVEVTFWMLVTGCCSIIVLGGRDWSQVYEVANTSCQRLDDRYDEYQDQCTNPRESVVADDTYVPSTPPVSDLNKKPGIDKAGRVLEIEEIIDDMSTAL